MSKIELPSLEAPQRDGDAVRGECEEDHEGPLSVADRCVAVRCRIDPADLSLVLHCSLVASRQRHIQHLFPHVITHPALTSHQRTRPKVQRLSSLLGPAPPPEWPLPALEYHDPAKASDKKKKKAAEDETRRPPAPAHEAECIARVTLTVGPLSYPDTELWVGRFVDPKTYVKPKVSRPPRPQDEQKASTTTVKTAKPSTKPPATASNPARPPAHRPPSNLAGLSRPPSMPTARPPPAGGVTTAPLEAKSSGAIVSRSIVRS